MVDDFAALREIAIGIEVLDAEASPHATSALAAAMRGTRTVDDDDDDDDDDVRSELNLEADVEAADQAVAPGRSPTRLPSADRLLGSAAAAPADQAPRIPSAERLLRVTSGRGQSVSPRPSASPRPPMSPVLEQLHRAPSADRVLRDGPSPVSGTSAPSPSPRSQTGSAVEQPHRITIVLV